MQGSEWWKSRHWEDKEGRVGDTTGWSLLSQVIVSEDQLRKKQGEQTYVW